MVTHSTIFFETYCLNSILKEKKVVGLTTLTTGLMFENMTLNEFLEKNGMTEAEFARQVEVNRSTIHRILRGELSPGLKLAHKIQRTTRNKVKMEGFAAQ